MKLIVGQDNVDKFFEKKIKGIVTFQVDYVNKDGDHFPAILVLRENIDFTVEK